MKNCLNCEHPLACHESYQAGVFKKTTRYRCKKAWTERGPFRVHMFECECDVVTVPIVEEFMSTSARAFLRQMEELEKRFEGYTIHRSEIPGPFDDVCELGEVLAPKMRRALQAVLDYSVEGCKWMGCDPEDAPSPRFHRGGSCVELAAVRKIIERALLTKEGE